MKRTVCAIMCFLLTLFIGVPVINSASKYMRAADDNGIKVIDFDVFMRENYMTGWMGNLMPGFLYVITEDHRVLYSGNLHSGNEQFEMIKDIDGNPLENVQKISGASYKAEEPGGIALREDGKLYVWGDNNYGQYGNGTVSSYSKKATVVDTGISNIVSVHATYSNYYFITANGDLYASGDNRYGQLGNGTTESSTEFTKVNLNNVKTISSAAYTVYAVTNDGSVYSWGWQATDGFNTLRNAKEPVQIHDETKTGYITNAIDVDIRNELILWYGYKYQFEHGMNGNYYFRPHSSIMTYDGTQMSNYVVTSTNTSTIVEKNYSFPTSQAPSSFTGIFFNGDYHCRASAFVLDGIVYSNILEASGQTEREVKPESDIDRQNLFTKDIPENLSYRVKKIDEGYTYPDHVALLEDGRIALNGKILKVELPLTVTAQKTIDDTKYNNGEKYQGDIRLKAIEKNGNPITCKVQDPVGSTEQNCEDFEDDQILISPNEDRIYRKYIFTSQGIEEEFVVDLYKKVPQLQGYSSSSINKIKKSDSINISVPADQASWNSYTATITNESNQSTSFAGGSLNPGKYTLTLTDSYGNTQDFQFEVTDKPEPTAVFTPSSSDLVYQDAYTKINGTVGTFSLQYPAGEPTSTIASIQLGTTGDESHFSIDTTGALKVIGNDLDAGTYNITVSGKDANQMDFTKTVQIVVGKANQDNYQITNNDNYNFLSNQEIAITTSGNESGENETYSIINGHTVAQISNTNKFKMLSAGTFTLEATVAGNNNYNSKTVTKQITLSQLPTQTNPIKISSGDSMMYGNTYTPTSTGGTGSGNVTWTIENDSGTGASLNNGSIRVTGVGTFTLKVTKAGDANYQSSSDSKVITVKQRKTVVKPKDVTRKVGEAFKDNGVAYNPQPIAGDSLGTPIITSKYPLTQQAGRYTDGIQVTGLTNPNYDFEYQEGTLIINDTTLPNNGSGYYKIEGTKGKNNWYVSDIKISTLNKDGYDLISSDGITFGRTPLIYQTDGDYPITFYLKNSTTGIIAKGINYQVKIDQTPPTVPTLTMNQLNTSRMARLINFLSFGNWMNTGAEVVMSSIDGTSGIDNYSYVETDTKGTSNTKTSTTGKVTYQDDVEIGITAKACDKAGNCSDLSASETLMIDRKGPDITGVKDQSVYKYYYLPRFVKVKDSGSGLSYAEYKKDGTQAGTIQEDVNERIDGVGKYEVNAIDNAGNESTLSFEIVPLPDIEDIDGSDESKDIIDQVKDEYEEVKDHLTEEERKEYEDWIKDAEDKWESERKQVIETDDKSSKVEGQNGTTFDPNLELIVNDISNQPLPPLPKNANVVYDVYLQKGNTKVEPDGSIKVYLPYTDSEAPIIYQIDENGKVTEIKAEKEGNYVTFITDELGKFAISNTAQPNNKDNMCVVGPDGAGNTGDEVCGKPNDKGDQPTKKPDGSVEVPDGGKVEFPNGTEIDTPNGAIINPDGSVTLPDGTEYDPDGNIKDDKKVCELDGKDINIDTDGDGLPDLNLDIDHDCIADLNIDTNFDNIPDINIDTKGDGKPDINVDTDGDGKANINIAVVKRWIPNKNCNYNGFAYDTGEGFTPILNIDDDGDGNPDRNIDDDGDGIPDRNIDPDWFDKYGNQTRDPNANIGGANTGDTNEWSIWWMMFICTGIILICSQTLKHKQKDTFQ